MPITPSIGGPFNNLEPTTDWSGIALPTYDGAWGPAGRWGSRKSGGTGDCTIKCLYRGFNLESDCVVALSTINR